MEGAHDGGGRTWTDAAHLGACQSPTACSISTWGGGSTLSRSSPDSLQNNEFRAEYAEPDLLNGEEYGRCRRRCPRGEK